MKLIVASNNIHKIKEIKEILGSSFESIFSLSEVGIDIDIVETGETFTENAQLKAKTILNILKAKKDFSDYAVLSDDSGIEVDALGGEPGVYSARFSGEGDEGNNQLLLEKLNGRPRGAQYRCVIVLLHNDQEIIGEGICRGEILTEYRGQNGFGYDPLFFSHDLKKTFAQASPQEKNSISHRQKALKEVLKKLSK